MALFTAAVGLLSACLVGCVGDSQTTPDASTSDSGIPQGSPGGACYANNTCDPGLQCVLKAGVGVCEAVDSGTNLDAGTDSAPPDAATPPSCEGLAHTCGPNAADCCGSPKVTGGTFSRSYDGVDGGSYVDPQYAATVADFRLDTYAVTVGRFRSFVAGYPADLPTSGAGKNPNNPADPGWNAAWNATMPATATDLKAALLCDATYQTWTDTPGSSESKAIDCVTWYEAFAFCIWDSGRLPTEAEWNYAAAGGSEQRAYPWSSPPTSTTLSASYAVYSTTSGIATVGSKSPQGDGKWGQADLAGNVWQWTLDWYATPYGMPCANCADLTAATDRVVRGGSYSAASWGLLTSFRNHGTPATRYNDVGFRCARTP
ncbi:MAG TPA: SUMF1/EgtB/PvdO family nonheme iron enzyme [Polyangiaceae bacterium]|nr:SUMF1/EgtB/PvdO family nonheme iron enzyme [Polyangiaceae bacterium]